MKIRWTRPAVDDLESIRDYIARDSDYYAASLVERILLAIDRLADLPEIGRRVPEAPEQDVRELITGSYRIIYRIRNVAVEVLSVIHGAREIGNLARKPWELP